VSMVGSICVCVRSGGEADCQPPPPSSSRRVTFNVAPATATDSGSMDSTAGKRHGGGSKSAGRTGADDDEVEEDEQEMSLPPPTQTIPRKRSVSGYVHPRHRVSRAMLTCSALSRLAATATAGTTTLPGRATRAGPSRRPLSRAAHRVRRHPRRGSSLSRSPPAMSCGAFRRAARLWNRRRRSRCRFQHRIRRASRGRRGPSG
jgi:hypothetical protein